MNKENFDLFCEKSYSNLSKSVGELQPIAFLISASLVLAGVFTKEGNLNIYEKPALMASFCFFFAYADLFAYKLTKHYSFLFAGFCSGFIGFTYILSAIEGFYLIVNPFETNTAITNSTAIIAQNNQSDLSYGIVTLLILTLSICSLTYYIVQYNNTIVILIPPILTVIYMLYIYLSPKIYQTIMSLYNEINNSQSYFFYTFFALVVLIYVVILLIPNLFKFMYKLIIKTQTADSTDPSEYSSDGSV